MGDNDDADEDEVGGNIGQWSSSLEDVWASSQIANFMRLIESLPFNFVWFASLLHLVDKLCLLIFVIFTRSFHAEGKNYSENFWKKFKNEQFGLCIFM
jgi:hypothetical protein